MGSFRGGRVLYRIVSAGAECGNDCSIQINGGEKAKKQRGLNLVIYNHELRSVVDSVCFDNLCARADCQPVESGKGGSKRRNYPCCHNKCDCPMGENTI